MGKYLILFSDDVMLLINFHAKYTLNLIQKDLFNLYIKILKDFSPLL